MTDTIRARPTIFCGIQMRSRLEADFAQWIDESFSEWEYEPRCFGGSQGQYLPDFGLLQRKGLPIYMEVKPAHLPVIDVVDALARMKIIWESEPDSILMLYLWTYQCRGHAVYFSAIPTRNRQWEMADDRGEF